MTLNKKITSNQNLKKSDWELDFYSRPIIERNGKKRWELIISSSKNFKTESIFLWNKICPANEVNSIWLTKSLKEALNAAENRGWAKPPKIRFWRSSMKSIIKLDYKVDKDLIGGLKLQLGSFMIDTSIKNKLKKYEQAMLEN